MVRQDSHCRRMKLLTARNAQASYILHQNFLTCTLRNKERKQFLGQKKGEARHCCETKGPLSYYVSTLANVEIVQATFLESLTQCIVQLTSYEAALDLWRNSC